MTEEQTRTPAPAPSTKKRSRTISSLTEKQVRQKREVDRKAQRAFRQRAKESFEKLEQQFRELQQTSRDTEAQLRHELEVLHGQNQRLLQCLAEIIESASTVRDEHFNAAVVNDRNGMASPFFFVGRYADISQPSVSRRSRQLEIERPHVPRTDTDTSGPPSSQNATQDLAEITSLDPELESIQIGSEERTPTSSCRRQDSGNAYDRLIQPGRATSDHPPDPYTLLPAEALDNGHLEIGYDEGLDDNSSHIRSSNQDTILLPAAATSQPSSTYHKLAPPAFESVTFGCSSTVGASVPSLQLLPTCHLDQVMLDFIHSGRNMLSQGSPLASIVGPAIPTVKALINPSACASVHDLSNVLSDILSTLINVRQTEKLALFYVMYKSMRWQITQTEVDYLAMPSWLRPTVTQTTLPHAAWIDNIPWPNVRDILIKDAPEYPIENFVEYYAQNISVNWKFDEDDSLADITGEVLLHSIFEKHINHLQNWSVSSDFQLIHPNLARATHFGSPI
ncbi:hypothetical protein BKA63DRAFT_503131 [Paraphoma chrysanthemicola]|nr:hypothetical protein BKA63DRAFT_503131 [Paraphoma chrysanthemicola]